MDNFLGEIKIFGGDFPPRGWAYCRGQLLPTTGYNANLYKLIGNKFGGDASRNTFALPNLQGTVPVGSGQGAGLTNRDLGKNYGAESTKLEVENLPPHIHAVNTVRANGKASSPKGNLFGGKGKDDNDYTNAMLPDVTMNSATVGVTGGIQPVTNMQPYIALNYIIALEGIYPQNP